MSAVRVKKTVQRQLPNSRVTFVLPSSPATASKTEYGEGGQYES